MADTDNSQERTQAPTEKRRREAREKGQVPRSRDLSKTLLLIVAAILFSLTGSTVVKVLSTMMQQGFTLSHNDIVNFSANFIKWRTLLTQLLVSLIPFVVSVFLCALLTPLLTGGWVFTSSLFAFKGSRLDPLAGIARMFSLNSLIELLKAVLKVGLLAVGTIIILKLKYKTIISLNQMPMKSAFAQSAALVAYSFILLSCLLIAILFLDVPFQLWQSAKQLKMTFQEAKQESRESDGSPEVRGRIRMLQQRLAKQRMLDDIPTADVVVTNPTHYAVALRYDQSQTAAPRVVAKGGGAVAENIRKIAKQNKVSILEAPVLARALFFSTEIGHEIPNSLYVAVAKVLAYVYQLKHVNVLSGNMPPPLKVEDLPIPEELRF